MEGLPSPESINDPELVKVVMRVAEHSKQFDEEAKAYATTPEEVRESWQIREWKIGDTEIKALGVSHVPETFLQFRNDIEKAIRESDIVVNEFAPEVLGFYQSSDELRRTPSRYNEAYTLEDLRNEYLKHEHEWNIGAFHHEVELLAAKYGKDMALADLEHTRDVGGALQRGGMYASSTENSARQHAIREKMKLYGASVALGATGALAALAESKKSMSRRKFLGLGLVGGATALAASVPHLVESPAPEKVMQKWAEEGTRNLVEYLRNPEIATYRDLKLAESLKKLSEMGYRKIAFIYGTRHLAEVEKYLNNPGKLNEALQRSREAMREINPDPFRIYRLKQGENHSERFVASPHMVWKRLAIGAQ